MDSQDMRVIALSFAFAAATFASALAHEHAHADLAGVPGDPARPSRTVEVTASEGDGRMSFAPARVEIARGEQVRFAIHNSGALAHEFVIGASSENAAHARMMAAMPDMRHDDPNAVTIPAGGSATLNWRFTKAGVFEFACLIPGHYEAGMHGVAAVK